MRHTTFRFALNPTPTQQGALARHAGASRYAYNQCLRTVTDALQARKRDPRVKVPWSGFDLINSFNAWKKSEDAGRVFIAAPDGTIVEQVTGLCWRQEVSAQVFEEAAVDLGHALAAYGGARTSARGNHRCRSFLHEVSSQLAKTHAKLVVEDLNVAGLVRNSRLARAVGDAAWTDFGRQLSYKAAWLDGELMLCDRWSPLRGPVGGVGRSSDRCGWRSAPFVATAAV